MCMYLRRGNEDEEQKKHKQIIIDTYERNNKRLRYKDETHGP